MMQMVARVQSSVQNIGTGVNTWARQWRFVARVLDAWAAYASDQMDPLAAALSYYFLLCLFPLLLMLIALASPFFEREQLLREVARFASNYLPTLAPEVRRILGEVVSARGPVTLIAALGLLWSASGVFDLLQIGMGRAWRVPAPRPLWRQRLISIGAVLIIGALFGLSFAASALSTSGIEFRAILGRRTVEVLGLALSIVLNFVLFAVIFKFMPNARIAWAQVTGAALFASIVWELGKLVFVWYLRNFAGLNLVYGSVGAVIAVMLWSYITANIMLFGAELTAVETRNRTKHG